MATVAPVPVALDVWCTRLLDVPGAGILGMPGAGMLGVPGARILDVPGAPMLGVSKIHGSLLVKGARALLSAAAGEWPRAYEG